MTINKDAIAVYAQTHGENHEAACTAVYNYGYAAGMAAAIALVKEKENAKTKAQRTA